MDCRIIFFRRSQSKSTIPRLHSHKEWKGTLLRHVGKPDIIEDTSFQYFMFQERFLPLGLDLRSQIFDWMKNVIILDWRAELIHSLMLNKDWVEMKIWHAKGRKFCQHETCHSYLQLNISINFNLAKVFSHLHDMSTGFCVFCRIKRKLRKKNAYQMIVYFSLWRVSVVSTLYYAVWCSSFDSISVQKCLCKLGLQEQFLSVLVTVASCGIRSSNLCIASPTHCT